MDEPENVLEKMDKDAAIRSLSQRLSDSVLASMESSKRARAAEEAAEGGRRTIVALNESIDATSTLLWDCLKPDGYDGDLKLWEVAQNTVAERDEAVEARDKALRKVKDLEDVAAQDFQIRRFLPLAGSLVAGFILLIVVATAFVFHSRASADVRAEMQARVDQYEQRANYFRNELDITKAQLSSQRERPKGIWVVTENGVSCLVDELPATGRQGGR